MLETLIPPLSHWPIIVRLPLEFLVDIIFIRGIIAPKIVSNIEHTGWMRVNIIHDMTHLINKLLPPKDSRKAISEHWSMHTKGDGHEANSVSGCYDGKCGELLAS